MLATPRSGDAVFSFGPDMVVRTWNEALERLTGTKAEDAIGRPCWTLLGAVTDRGDLVCHAGCSGARLAREGWPVPCRHVLIRTASGRKRIGMSTISLLDCEADGPIVIHLLRNGEEVAQEPPPGDTALTARQLQVLRLLAEGKPAKVIAQELGLAEVTVRNHIRGILVGLRCHSQLAAIAEGRRRQLI